MEVNGYSVGVFEPGIGPNGQYLGASNTDPLPGTADGYQCAYINLPFGGDGKITSDTVGTAQANTVYSLTRWLGKRLDIDVGGDVTIAILVDGQAAASTTVHGSSLPDGTFTDASTSFRSTSTGGNIQIRLSYASVDHPGEDQVNFDNVRLTATS